jgi:hypothetical protein
MFLVSKSHLDKASDGMMARSCILRPEKLGPVSLVGNPGGLMEYSKKKKKAELMANVFISNPWRRVWVSRKL